MPLAVIEFMPLRSGPYRTACGAKVDDEGYQFLVVADDHVDGTPTMVKARVAQVSRPLLSVAALVDAGFTVVFDGKGAWASQASSGRRLAGSLMAVRPSDAHATMVAQPMNSMHALEEPYGVRVAPPSPGKEEVERLTTHEPYRSWCRWCQMAAGRRRRNERQREETHDLQALPM
eukprot:6475803-Amphidinium_carterae.1